MIDGQWGWQLVWRRTASVPRALQLGELTGAFAAMAIGLNALATAVLVPLLFRLLG